MSKILEELQNELAQYHDDSVLDNRSRFIIHDDKYIYLYLKESDILAEASYSPELYHFMSRPSCCSYSYDYKKERIQIELMAQQKTGKRYKPTLGAFLQRWYCNQKPIEEFLLDVVNETKKGSVDHANAGKHNHCRWNLSNVTGSQNSQKGTLSYQIKPPYFCYIAVTPDSKYRVLFGYSDGFLHKEQQYWLCNDMNALISLLKEIMKTKRIPAWIKQYGTPMDVRNREPNAYCASEDFAKTAQHVERLLSLNDSDFAVWTVNKAAFLINISGKIFSNKDCQVFLKMILTYALFYVM